MTVDPGALAIGACLLAVYGMSLGWSLLKALMYG